MERKNNNEKFKKVFEEIDYDLQKHIDPDYRHSSNDNDIIKKSMFYNTALMSLWRNQNEYPNVTYEEKIDILKNFLHFEFEENESFEIILEIMKRYETEIRSLNEKRKYVKELENIEKAKNIDLSKYKKMIMEFTKGTYGIYTKVISRLIFNEVESKPAKLCIEPNEIEDFYNRIKVSNNNNNIE